MNIIISQVKHNETAKSRRRVKSNSHQLGQRNILVVMVMGEAVRLHLEPSVGGYIYFQFVSYMRLAQARNYKQNMHQVKKKVNSFTLRNLNINL